MKKFLRLQIKMQTFSMLNGTEERRNITQQGASSSVVISNCKEF